ncbi:MAG TPA: TRAM domain-containing protein, partial [Candidatus Brocadiia bacterium]|nr:TRAM domain-containing protein [Candidatus Brocadiia bacterium]
MSEVVEVRFDDVAYGGDGVARLPDGMAVFAPFAAAGDVARVRLTERRPRFWRGEIVEIVAPGEGREAAACPYYGVCGGCRYQHVTAGEEARLKRGQLEQLLARVAGMKGAPEVEAPGTEGFVRGTRCDPAAGGLPQHVPGGGAVESVYGYRNKLTLSPILEKGRAKGWGFTAMDNRTVTAIERCALGHEDLNRTLGGLSRSGAWPKAPAQEPGAGLVLRRSAKGEVVAFREAPEMWLHERVLGVEVVVPAGGFYQVNPAVL